MEKCAIYSRSSTQNQDTTSATNVLKQYADQQGYVYTDDDIFEENVSAVKDVIKFELERLKNHVIDKKIDHVLIWEVSRVGRSLKSFVDLSEHLNKNKINLFIYKDKINTLNPDKTINTNANLLLNILASIANNETIITKERTKRGLGASAQKGVFGGLTPYGYNRKDKQLSINDDEAAVVKMIFELFLSGMGTMRVANRLNELKIETRYNKFFKDKLVKYDGFTKSSTDYEWVSGTIYAVLSNSTYVGNRMFNGQPIHLPHLRIIDDETFNRVSEILTTNRIKKDKTTRQRHFYLLDKMDIKCGICGRNYNVRLTKDASTSNYSCLSKRYKKDCGNHTIGIDRLNSSIWSFLRNSSEIERKINKSIEESDIKKEIVKVKDELSAATERNKTILSNGTKLYNLYKTGKMFEEIYTKEFKLLDRDKNRVDMDLSRLDSKLKELQAFEQSQNNLATILKNIKLDPHTMKEYITDIVKSITIFPIDGNSILSDHKQDKMIMVELQLFSNLHPILYVISQRSDKIMQLGKGQYKNGKLLGIEVNSNKIKPFRQLNDLYREKKGV
jgi:DNA invertase Pin-like site-specific DNA recombinase